MKVYSAINKVQADLARDGISKDRKNAQQGYNFRGIDDMYNALAPVLSKHGLCVLPRVKSRECVERMSAKGAALLYVTVEVDFDFVAAEDGSKHTITTYGEAMDSGDKATNKAMSAAYKYAAMQAFAIPTEGDNDADAQTHQVAPMPKLTPINAYSEDKFTENVPTWRHMVKTNQATVEQIKAKLQTKYTLTESQIGQLNALNTKEAA